MPERELPCPHGRETWRMCPHCLGANEATRVTAGRAQESTPEQLAEKVRLWMDAHSSHMGTGSAALSELVARLATAQTERDEAESLAQQIRNRAERAEAERDEVTAELAKLLAEFKLQRDERDRLAAALNRERLYRERTEGLPEGTLPREPEGELRIERDSFGTRYVREALNPGDAQ